MDCRHTILSCNKWVYLKIKTKGDYNYKRQITMAEWFAPTRYELGIYRRGNGQGYKWWINKSSSIW